LVCIKKLCKNKVAMSTSDLISAINAASDSPAELKEEDRAALLAACGELRLRLENTREGAMRAIFAVS